MNGEMVIHRNATFLQIIGIIATETSLQKQSVHTTLIGDTVGVLITLIVG